MSNDSINKVRQALGDIKETITNDMSELSQVNLDILELKDVYKKSENLINEEKVEKVIMEKISDQKIEQIFKKIVISELKGWIDENLESVAKKVIAEELKKTKE